MKKKSTFTNRLGKIFSLVGIVMLITMVAGCKNPFNMKTIVEYRGETNLYGETKQVILSFKESRYVTLEISPELEYKVEKDVMNGITVSKTLKFKRVFGTYDGSLEPGSEVKIGLAILSDIKKDAKVTVNMPTDEDGTISFNLIPWDDSTNVTLSKKTQTATP